MLVWRPASSAMTVVCDSHKPGHGDEVEVSLTLLGYGDYGGDRGERQREAVEDEAAWEAPVADWGTDADVSPDLDTEMVFVNTWKERGRGDEEPTYGAWTWTWGEALRMRAVESGSCSNDMSLPNIDLLMLTTDGATDLGWSE